MNITQHAKDLLEARDNVRSLKEQIRDFIVADSELYNMSDELEQLKEQVKRLKNSIVLRGGTELAELEQEKKDWESKSTLLKDIITAELVEEQPTLPKVNGVVGVEYEGYLFKIKEGLKVQKVK